MGNLDQGDTEGEIMRLSRVFWFAAACALSVGWSVPVGEKPVRICLMAGQSNMGGPGNNTQLAELAPDLLKVRDDVGPTKAVRRKCRLTPITLSCSGLDRAASARHKWRSLCAMASRQWVLL